MITGDSMELVDGILGKDSRVEIMSRLTSSAERLKNKTTEMWREIWTVVEKGR